MAVTDGHTDVGFGDFLRNLREEQKIGQRELARNIGISAPYLNDIEKGNRPAPKEEILRSMADALGADLQIMFDLAAESRQEIPEDVAKIIKQDPEITPLVRAIADYSLDGQKIKDVKKNMESSNVKGLIIAAGIGSRLKPLTDDLPKCMLKFGNKTLFERQLGAYKANGIRNISVIRGYQKEKIDFPDLKYYENPNYESNNILSSLFCAEQEINGHVIISYSDILFEDQVIARLLQSTHDISLVVDIDWKGYYVGRQDHPYEEVESVIFDADNNVVEIGKILKERDDVHGEFIGMMKLTPRGAKIFKRHFKQAQALYDGKPFQRAQNFQQAYLTDFIQHMVNLGVHVHCVIIERGWKEIDTVEDYEKALKEFKE